jgi:uncharacterized RDD family membrane protein YckC
MEPRIEPKTRLTLPRKSEGAPLPSRVDLSDLDKITEDNLDFSAITDGLGFHPRKRIISDKMPTDFGDDDLAPSSQVAATSVKPNPVSPEEISAAIKQAETPKIQAPKANADAKTALTHSNANAVDRSLAFLADFIFIFVPLWTTFLWMFSSNLGLLADNFPLTLGFSFFVFFSYFLIAEGLCGQSLGKMLLGIAVVEDDKYRKPIPLSKAALRIGGFILSLAPLGAGLLAALWDSKSRAWHDRLSSSIVEKKIED